MYACLGIYSGVYGYYTGNTQQQQHQQQEGNKLYNRLESLLLVRYDMSYNTILLLQLSGTRA